MLLILIIGIAFIVISSGHSDRKAEENDAEYKGEEVRLSEILSEIDGAGEVSVMISYVSTMEKDIAYDGENERAVTSGGDVVVKREVYPQVKGVIVISEGANIPAVRQALSEAVTAVTGASANHVCVYSGKRK
jgi:stage III sporulation protein AG